MDLTLVDHLHTTTRSVRKRLDLTRSVEPEVVLRCLEIAVQPPTGANRALAGARWTSGPSAARRWRSARERYSSIGSAGSMIGCPR